MYGDMKNQGPIMEIPMQEVKKGMCIFLEGRWVKAKEDFKINEGYAGFQFEDEEFKLGVCQVRQNDLAYQPRIKVERDVAFEVFDKTP